VALAPSLHVLWPVLITTVYASMRETTGCNAPQVKEVKGYAAIYGVDPHATLVSEAVHSRLLQLIYMVVI
jgi:hypothetical protein